MDNSLKLWYKEPARQWVDSLPLGNGRIGVMVSGDVFNERIALNEDTLWTGIPRKDSKGRYKQYLDEARSLIFDEKYYEAQELMNNKLLAGYTESYAPFGDLLLNFTDEGEYEGYSRELDLNTAKAIVKYKINDVNFKREVFVSAVDSAVVINITADKCNSINFSASLKSLLKSTVENEGEDTISIKGIAPVTALPSYVDEAASIIYDENDNEGIKFQGTLRVRSVDGIIYEKDKVINVKSASEVTLILVMNTSFNGFNKMPGSEGKDQELLCNEQLESIENKQYDELVKRHVDDYAELFNRVSFQLGKESFSNVPTDERLEKLRNGNKDLELISLYFNFGRYLLISCSRDGSQPANLQGIWNEDLRPAWSSNYTVNINTEMNYWPAEVCNLSECHKPLLDMVKDLSIAGEDTAESTFGCRGWTANHNVDLWRYSNTVAGSSEWGFWPMGGPWLCQHIWEHYAFTGDKKYLKNYGFPIIKGAVLFILDYLTEDNNGNIVTCPSTSPENNFLDKHGRKCCASMMTTMDVAIIKDLFNNCLKSMDVLGIDNKLKRDITYVLEKMPEYKVNKKGGVQEWYKDFDEYEPGHRHMSHLFGLYPGKDITAELEPKIYKACNETLKNRLSEGGGHTGWSCAWIINFYARLKDGEEANKYLKTLLNKLTFINLFCVHPPFQIDGNFGGTAGIAEMLIQSHNGVIELIPAIPKEWHTGEVKGLKARGGFIVNFKWEKGIITSLEIESTIGGKCTVKFGEVIEFKNIKSKITIDTVAKMTYKIK